MLKDCIIVNVIKLKVSPVNTYSLFNMYKHYNLIIFKNIVKPLNNYDVV